jgi:hypothetical protein
MTTKHTLVATACFASLCGALHGQTGEMGATFQYFINNDITTAKVRMEGLGKTVTGKPFSATEERQTIQVLGDGTRIDKKETDKYFRDTQGRTRTERNNGETIVISDPVDGFNAELNTTNKSAHKMIVRMRTITGPASAPNVAFIEKQQAEIATTASMAQGQTLVFNRSEPLAGKEPRNAATEDLGTQMINGVPAQGTRSTITIPAGQIGNDREIKVVSERWFSNDLQMLIKSSNNDPRFGETTYQLTNVIQGAQDPTLFQIPADFNVNGPPR